MDHGAAARAGPEVALSSRRGNLRMYRFVGLTKLDWARWHAQGGSEQCTARTERREGAALAAGSEAGPVPRTP
ncbi:hypothetical protein Acsp03_51730 [Actinomadura sp. NBRC 104412]|nr:hypothetical protein Acsp03_51730 [Actinomadura sp. NBRC 104412]